MSGLHRGGRQLRNLRQLAQSVRDSHKHINERITETQRNLNEKISGTMQEIRETDVRGNLREGIRRRDAEFRAQFKKIRKVPKWLRICKKIYHQYGLKHILLFLVLIGYQFLGACIFYVIEAQAEEDHEVLWRARIETERGVFIERLVPLFFNNSQFLFFPDGNQSSEINRLFEQHLNQYEIQLGIKSSDQKIKWDFWNAMLYAGTVCTTIGYGHLYPTTTAGRLMTMIYAIFGIPLVLSILDDMGKLLTRILKYPWLITKMICRRLFRCCTNQSMEEIRAIDAAERRGLAIFDLPIPVAIGIVIGWIFVCSATFCLWETEWDYFVAFYFFFISLSTIGLGDIVPSQPKYLLMLFGYIIVGLSLVSMCVNLIQAKLEQSYEAGGEDLTSDSGIQSPPSRLEQPRATLGIFQQRNSSYSLASQKSTTASPARLPKKSKTCQTLLSFPSPVQRFRPGLFKLANGSAKGRFLPNNLSIDDVMRLVDTEEDDILICADLNGQSAAAQQESRTVPAAPPQTPAHQIKAQIDHDPNDDSSSITNLLPGPQPLSDVEEIEEIEDIENDVLLGSLTRSHPASLPLSSLAGGETNPAPSRQTQRPLVASPADSASTRRSLAEGDESRRSLAGSDANSLRSPPSDDSSETKKKRSIIKTTTSPSVEISPAVRSPSPKGSIAGPTVHFRNRLSIIDHEDRQALLQKEREEDEECPSQKSHHGSLNSRW